MAGPTMVEQLPGLMSGLEGQWGSRRRRMTVDDSELGDRLPKGWKLLLGLLSVLHQKGRFVMSDLQLQDDLEQQVTVILTASRKDKSKQKGRFGMSGMQLQEDLDQEVIVILTASRKDKSKQKGRFGMSDMRLQEGLEQEVIVIRSATRKR